MKNGQEVLVSRLYGGIGIEWLIVKNQYQSISQTAERQYLPSPLYENIQIKMSSINDHTGIFQNIYINSDLIQTQFVGNVRANVLRVIAPVQKKGEIETFTFDPIFYFPLRIIKFNTVEINITSDIGNLVPFDGGVVVVVLHLRRKHNVLICVFMYFMEEELVPQSGGRLISNNLGRPSIFLPRAQVGYGIGGVLKPLARTLLTTLKSQAKKIPGYLGKIAKKHGKKAAQQLITGVISGKIKKGQRKKAIKRLAVSNLQKAQQNIKKDIKKAVIKSIRPQKPKATPKPKPKAKAKKQPLKRKALFLSYRRKPIKKRRKDIFDK